MRTFYLIAVHKMMTCDECDIVVKWSAIVAEDDLSKISIIDAAKVTDIQLIGAPVTNLRAMTEDEIGEWRKEND